MSQLNSLKSGVNTTSQTRNSQKVQTSIASKIQKLQFMDEEAEKLARYFFSKKFLGEKKNFFRKRQQAALKALIHHLNAGGNGGMIKLPTGTGKTFLFGNIIKALSTPSIVLVPRENLVDGTYDEFVGNAKKSGLDFDASQVHRIYGKEKGNTSLQAQKILQNGEFSGTLIITYHSFVKLCESDPILFEQLVKNTGCIISDEAHRSLGDKTTQALSKAKEFIDNSNNENEEIDDEILDETILDKIDGMLGEDGYSEDDEIKAESIIDELLQKSNIVHIHTTATPQLALKKVQEEVVYASTFGEVVMDGDLILPKQLSLGTAKTEVNGEKITEKENKKGLDKFYFEDGMAVYEELTLQYMDQKEKNGGYLPTVAFCNTTEQVEFYVQYLLSEGVKAIQCTTNTKGTNYCDISTAESKLESGEADVIVTCSKVGEGWDLPTLRGAMWLVPSLSPARVMQGTGRITRILNESDIERLMDLTGLSREYIQKTHQNTIVFSPNKWTYTKASNPDSEGEVPGEDREKENEEPSESQGSQSSLPLGDIFTGLELYGKYGELSLEQIKALGLDIEGLKMFLTQDELFQVLWNYEGRSEQESYDHFMGLTAKGIANLEIGGNKISSLLTFSGLQIKGNIFTPSGFQEWIGKIFGGKNIVRIEKKIYTLNSQNQIEIDGVVYTAITRNMKQEDYRDLPDNGGNILKKMKQLSEEEIKELTGVGKEARVGIMIVLLYDLKKIQEKFKVITLNDKNQAEIEGVVYTAITNSMKQEDYRDLPDNGANILYKMKQLSEEEIKELTGARKEARIGNKIVPLYDLKKIQEKFKIITLNDKSQAEIEGVVYTAITNSMKQEDYRDLPDHGYNILNKMKELSEEEMNELIGARKEVRIGSTSVPLYDLKKIQEKFRIYTLNSHNQVEINGVVYTAITGTMKQEEYTDLPDNGKNILRKMKKLSEKNKKVLIGAGKAARVGNHRFPLYDLQKIQEMFGKK